MSTYIIYFILKCKKSNCPQKSEIRLRNNANYSKNDGILKSEVSGFFIIFQQFTSMSTVFFGLAKKTSCPQNYGILKMK
jgi:hypothetical protein